MKKYNKTLSFLLIIVLFVIGILIKNSITLPTKESSIIDEIPYVIKELGPTGFAGSSLNRINLYSNGDAYWVQYDGTGFEEENIIKNQLIAKNAEEIKYSDDEYGEEIIAIVGSNIEIVENILTGWIKFQDIK